jgi:hypothetical protein
MDHDAEELLEVCRISREKSDKLEVTRNNFLVKSFAAL